MFCPDFNAIRNMIISVAKDELLPRFEKISHQHKMDGSIVTEADYVVQDKIQSWLITHYPESILLGEEMTIQEQALAFKSEQALWCLDPLDGTSNFAFGIPYFAISLALIEKGQVTFGLVYDPVRDECFMADRDSVLLNDNEIERVIPSMNLDKATAIIDFKRLSASLAVNLVKSPPYSSQRNFGASALDWCWLALGRGHVYLHGKQNIWDYAAGHFIFEKSGGLAKTLAEENVFKFKLEKRSVVAAVNLRLFEQWMTWLKLNA